MQYKQTKQTNKYFGHNNLKYNNLKYIRLGTSTLGHNYMSMIKLLFHLKLGMI